MKQYIKNTFGILTIALAASAATAGEIEQFISETMAERRVQNAREAVNTEAKSEIQQIVLPESKLTAKTKSLKSRCYKYDKAGRLVSVACEACPKLNESYVYDKQGNILEKRVGDKVYTYKYDTANQLASMESTEGLREYVYDMAGRLIEEKLNGKIDVKYTYGYLDKVTEVNRSGKITKFVYDGTGMLASKISSDGKVENWIWDGLALIRRGKDIHVNEPHISGGVPIVSRTSDGTQFHESDFLGTTLWSIDAKGNVVSFQNDTIFGDGTIKTNRCARFTGKPYDEDLQAYVFPYRNYDASTARWRSSDPAGYPDGMNQHFYACNPTTNIDVYGLDLILVGQGGAGYGSLFAMAAETYARNNGQKNQIVHVNNGAEAINAINDYAANNGGKVDSLQVFAHSGSQAIWFDMGESSQSSLYINTPAGADQNARSVSDINGSYFDGNSNIKLWGCNTANGEGNIAQAIGAQTGNNVTGANSGTYFSSTPDGPYDPKFSARAGTNDPVYLVPHGDWETYIYSPTEK